MSLSYSSLLIAAPGWSPASNLLKAWVYNDYVNYPMTISMRAKSDTA